MNPDEHHSSKVIALDIASRNWVWNRSPSYSWLYSNKTVHDWFETLVDLCFEIEFEFSEDIILIVHYDVLTILKDSKRFWPESGTLEQSQSSIRVHMFPNMPRDLIYVVSNSNKGMIEIKGMNII